MQRRWLGLALVAFAAASPAQNLIVNGDFNTDSHGWAFDSVIESWSAQDWDGGASGSQYIVTNPSWWPDGGSMTQCVDVHGLNRIDFSFYSYLQPAVPMLEAFDGADCAGTDLGTLGGVTITKKEWFEGRLDDLALPATTTSVRVSFPFLAQQKLLIDHVQLRASGQIYADGFENAAQ
ncbi:MAG TPA: hypothetical protein VF132_11195 [Rudaea sp.]